MSTFVNRTTVLAFTGTAALAAAFIGFVVAPLDDPAASTARIQARLMAVEPPQLWRAEAQGPDGRSQATFVCADTPLADTFARGLPEVNGEICRVTTPPVIKPGLFAARCEALGRRFAISSATHGDLKRSFRLDFALSALDVGGPPARQSIRYERLGACPAGWRIGDQARAPAPR